MASLSGKRLTMVLKRLPIVSSSSAGYMTLSYTVDSLKKLANTYFMAALKVGQWLALAAGFACRRLDERHVVDVGYCAAS